MIIVVVVVVVMVVVHIWVDTVVGDGGGVYDGNDDDYDSSIKIMGLKVLVMVRQRIRICTLISCATPTSELIELCKCWRVYLKVSVPCSSSAD